MTTGRQVQRRIYGSVQLRIVVAMILFVAAATAFRMLDSLGVPFDVGAYTSIPGVATQSVLAELVPRGAMRSVEP